MGVVYTSKELIKMLEQDKWYLVATEGSHAQYKHPTKQGKVTIPRHSKDIKKGTANSILKQAGLK
jgi:predicted RNA binding protein YcfA (HicA-like mRNA interferase family)